MPRWRTNCPVLPHVLTGRRFGVVFPRCGIIDADPTVTIVADRAEWERVIRRRSSRSLSIVGAAAGQDTLDDDRPRGDVEFDDHAPVTDPQPRLWAALERSQVGASRIGGEAIDRSENSLPDLRIEPSEISVSAPFEFNRPRLCGHVSPCLRMISA